MKDFYEISEVTMYPIAPDRIKKMVKEREGFSLASLHRDYLQLLITERSFKRNLNTEKAMKGSVLLAIAKALNCTPYYFIEPSPMGILLEPLAYWHYEFQTTSIADSFYKFFLARSLPPDQIKKISREDRQAFEEHARQIINRYKED